MSFAALKILTFNSNDCLDYTFYRMYFKSEGNERKLSKRERLNKDRMNTLDPSFEGALRERLELERVVLARAQ
jgi:hypothetical protein